MYGDIAFTFVGTVAQDRELGQLANGQARATVNVAVNTPKKNRDTGEYEEATTWVRLAIFGDRANSASVDRCLKGMPVFVRGTVQSYTQEIAGRNYTFYNFRPDIIRPLVSIEDLDRKQQMRRERPAASSDKSQTPPPAGALPENDDGNGYFDD